MIHLINAVVQLFVGNNLLTVNTFFKLHPRKLYTWKSPVDKEGKIGRIQIDFILFDPNFKDIKYVKPILEQTV